MNSLSRVLLFPAVFASSAQAGFHVMQIEEVIGGINGDPTAQAIQLRMRTGGQTVLSAAKLWAWDAAGTNRVLLLDITTNVTNGSTGDRILLASTSFDNKMIAGGATTFTPDYVLASVMPASYLNAGRITFEDNGGSVASAGTIYWSVTWGGAAYTGPTTGDATNDSDGNFGKFGSILPAGPFQALRFQGAATDPSLTNATDYALTGTAATVTKNSGAAFLVVPEPGNVALVALGAIALGAFSVRRRRRA